MCFRRELPIVDVARQTSLSQGITEVPFITMDATPHIPSSADHSSPAKRIRMRPPHAEEGC